MYCVYLITYSGDKHPLYYIGSTSVQKIEDGYLGSTSSKKYKDIVLNEQKINSSLYKIKILHTTNTRKEALEIEFKIQEEFLVVTSDLFWNLSYAQINGFFGMDVAGMNSPRYGTKHTESTKQKIGDAERGEKNHNWGGITCPKHLANMSKAKMGKNNPMYNKTGEKHHNWNTHHTQKSKDKMSKSIMTKPILVCPHCGLRGKSGGASSAMKRWHFDNCKFK